MSAVNWAICPRGGPAAFLPLAYLRHDDHSIGGGEGIVVAEGSVADGDPSSHVILPE